MRAMLYLAELSRVEVVPSARVERACLAALGSEPSASAKIPPRGDKQLVPDAGHDPARRKATAFEAAASADSANRARCGVHGRDRTVDRRSHIPERFHCATRTIELVGMAGFEPAASCTPCTRAARLRHTPRMIGLRGEANSRPHAPKARALPAALRGEIWSAWQGSNLRPRLPERRALPGCATRR